MSKVSNDQAVKDIERWLDAKKIKDRKREQNADSEAVLVDAIMDGDLIVNDDNSLTLKLIWPTAEGQGVSTLTFKSRLTVGERQEATKGIKPTDAEGRLIGYVAVLTDQPVGVIKKLESGEDYERASSIAVYFL